MRPAAGCSPRHAEEHLTVNSLRPIDRCRKFFASATIPVLLLFDKRRYDICRPICWFRPHQVERHGGIVERHMTHQRRARRCRPPRVPIGSPTTGSSKPPPSPPSRQRHDTTVFAARAAARACEGRPGRPRSPEVSGHGGPAAGVPNPPRAGLFRPSMPSGGKVRSTCRTRPRWR